MAAKKTVAKKPAGPVCPVSGEPIDERISFVEVDIAEGVRVRAIALKQITSGGYSQVAMGSQGAEQVKAKLAELKQ